MASGLSPTTLTTPSDSSTCPTHMSARPPSQLPGACLPACLLWLVGGGWYLEPERGAGLLHQHVRGAGIGGQHGPTQLRTATRHAG